MKPISGGAAAASTNESNSNTCSSASSASALFAPCSGVRSLDNHDGSLQISFVPPNQDPCLSFHRESCMAGAPTRASRGGHAGLGGGRSAADATSRAGTPFISEVVKPLLSPSTLAVSSTEGSGVWDWDWIGWRVSHDLVGFDGDLE